MKSGVRVAMALGAGYVLGRNHKMRLALALGAAAATGQLGRAPGQLAQKGTKALGDTPLGGLQEPGKQLVEAGKSAAVAAVVGRINSLSDRLQAGAGEDAEATRGNGGRGHDEDGADEARPALKRAAGKLSARETARDDTDEAQDIDDSEDSGDEDNDDENDEGVGESTARSRREGARR